MKNFEFSKPRTTILARNLRNILNTHPTLKTAPGTRSFFFSEPSIYFASKCKSQTTIFDCGNKTFSGYVDLISGIHCSSLLEFTL